MKKILRKIKDLKFLKKEGYVTVADWMEKHKSHSMFCLAWAIWWRVAVVSFLAMFLLKTLMATILIIMGAR